MEGQKSLVCLGQHEGEKKKMYNALKLWGNASNSSYLLMFIIGILCCLCALSFKLKHAADRHAGKLLHYVISMWLGRREKMHFDSTP